MHKKLQKKKYCFQTDFSEVFDLKEEKKYSVKEQSGTDPGLLADNDEINLQACSTMDCTGLVPTPPRSEEEIDSYEELYPFLTRAIPVSPQNRKP